MRVAAVDVGTNSIHLLVAEVSPEGTITVLEKARAQVGLGSHGLTEHRIAEDAFARGLDALRRFKALADRFGVEDVHTAATSAVREAANGREFCRAVREEIGIHLRVISGAEEARLVWLGARDHVDVSRGPVLLCDLGGGSTEMILCDRDGMRWSHSFPLGHIRLAEAFHHSDRLTPDERRAMKRHVREVLTPLRLHVGDGATGGIIGTSGTFRALARMASLRAGRPLPGHEEGLVLTRRELEALLDDFERIPRAELGSLPGMDEKRRETLPAGAVLVREILKATGAEQLTTTEHSLRDGLVVDWVERHRPEIDLSRTYTDPRERSIRYAMQRFCRDEPHARYVTDLALRLFDATASLHGLTAKDRELLRAAALLHDIGHHVGGRDHHKHGHYLLRHIRLYGFTAPEVATLAAVVRYHTGSLPKVEHPEWRALSKEDRQRVRVMAGLLRVADALDRSHTQPVRRLEVEIHPREVAIRAVCDQGGELELWTATERRVLLERALHRPVRVEVVHAPAEPVA